MTAITAFALGLLAGAIACAVFVRPINPYARWLGRTCWVRPWNSDDWCEHTCIAVSWMGAVCVRRTDTPDGNGYWVKKENVGWRVRWSEP